MRTTAQELLKHFIKPPVQKDYPPPTGMADYDTRALHLATTDLDLARRQLSQELAKYLQPVKEKAAQGNATFIGAKSEKPVTADPVSGYNRHLRWENQEVSFSVQPDGQIELTAYHIDHELMDNLPPSPNYKDIHRYVGDRVVVKVGKDSTIIDLTQIRSGNKTSTLPDDNAKEIQPMEFIPLVGKDTDVQFLKLQTASLSRITTILSNPQILSHLEPKAGPPFI